MRLLVVEDEKSLRDDITKKLRLDGYEADACGDGNEARELLAVEYYDLVLLDLNLPGVDGMTILREFRAVNDETPVLILSARSEITDRWMGWTQARTTTCPSRSIWRSLRHAYAA